MIILWIILGLVVVIFGVCLWVGYRIGQCLDRFDEFNFEDEL